MPKGLEQLRDIHLPHTLPWWPLAPGFYLLFILCIGGGLLGLFLYYTRHARRLRQQALYELARIERDYLQHHHVSVTAARISLLLKQVALMLYARTDVAALQGEEWLDFLKKSSKKLPMESIRALLLEAPFCAEHPAPIDPLFTVAKAWIKQRSRLCLN